MDSCLPTLTLDGFVTNKQIMFYKIWEYFLTSEYSQSNTFSIYSYKYIMATAFETNNIQSIGRNMESSLENLYKKYYDNAKVDCETIDDLETNTLKVRISITVSDNGGSTYSLAKELENTNGELKNYNELLNELYNHYAQTY
jgi:hypothetical protein